jgi:hypothetical protein
VLSNTRQDIFVGRLTNKITKNGNVTAHPCFLDLQSAAVQAFMTVANVMVLLFVVVAGAYAGYNTGWQGYKQADG